MHEDDPITLWLTELRGGDDDAAEKLWNHFATRLRAFARTRLSNEACRVYDEDDAVVSGFFSFCRGVKNGRFSGLNDKSDLWRLLVVITARKATRRHRYEHRLKRGGDRCDCSVVFADTSDLKALGGLPGREPTPEFAAELAETWDALFAQLSDDSQRHVAAKKLEGFTNQEIADDLDIGLRSVERKLHLIRLVWENSVEDFDP